MRLIASLLAPWLARHRRPGRHAADPVVAPLVRLAQPPACWTCPLCHHTWPYINPQHDCPADRPPDQRSELGIPRRRIVPPYYWVHSLEAQEQAREREEFLDGVRADLGPLVRTLLDQRAERAPTQPLEVVR